ncbi:MAG TPA: phosphotransferase, partial [Roseiflexaceae bacterium]|nr:phosphotransferase [Roseiflexaceae bacterium]
DAPTAIRQVYGALGAGRSYFVNRYDGACPELVCHTERAGERCAIGSSPSLRDGPLVLVADAGRAADLRLIHNGRVAATARRSLRYDIREPGVYRLEGYRKGRAWLFTNPIYVSP